MTRARWIIIAVLVAILIVLVLQNTSVVTVKLLFWEISMSQIILLPMVFALGFIVGIILMLLRDRKKKEAS